MIATPAPSSLFTIVTSNPPASIGEVIQIMDRLDAALTENDGLKWFNLLYLQVTRQVQQHPPQEDNPGLAQRFLAAVQEAISKICQRPGIGAPKLIDNPKLAGLRCWLVAGLPSIRILHGKRDINPMLENESDEP